MKLEHNNEWPWKHEFSTTISNLRDLYELMNKEVSFETKDDGHIVGVQVKFDPDLVRAVKNQIKEPL